MINFKLVLYLSYRQVYKVVEAMPTRVFLCCRHRIVVAYFSYYCGVFLRILLALYAENFSCKTHTHIHEKEEEEEEMFTLFRMHVQYHYYLFK